MSTVDPARSRLLVAGIASLAVLVFALLAAPPAKAAGVGAVADVTWGQPREAIDREIALLRDAGVRWLRMNVNWNGLEPDAKGVINEYMLGEYDYAVERAHAAGLQVLMPIADGVPYWASADPRKSVDGAGKRSWNVTYRPAQMSDYGDVVRFVVEHFSAKGVHAFQIWNEPNLARFWPSGPNAAEYTEMLRAGYEAAKAVDPSATVLLGGLSKSDFYFLEDVYRAGGGAYFDAAAVHPYTYGVDPTVGWNGVHSWEDPDRISINAFPAIQEIRRSMEAFGDGGKSVWLTEFGYSTTTHDGGVSEETQAAFLAKAYAYVQQFPWVHTMFWYSARNNPFLGDADSYEAQFGLMTTDWRLKPSYAALQAYALGAARASGKVRLERGRKRRVWVDGRRAVRVRLWGRVVLRQPVSWRVAVAARQATPRVLLQRRTPRGWITAKRVPTGQYGHFRTKVLTRRARVRYRVVARYSDTALRSRVIRVRTRL